MYNIHNMSNLIITTKEIEALKVIENSDLLVKFLDKFYGRNK